MASDRLSDSSDDRDDSREASFGNLQTVGMVLFLAALTMLFVSGLIGYVWIREGENSFSGHIHLPVELWLSTVLVIGVSIALRRAGTQLRLGKQRSFRNALTASLALAIGFLTVQTPALIQLLNEHQHQALLANGMRLYGFVFFLVLLHALHVVGGMVALVVVTAKAYHGEYEGAEAGAIRNTALYWHFLDLVWIVMFGVLFVLR